MEVRGHVSSLALGDRRLDVGGVPMTRFVYVLPAGRLRWEVRVDYEAPRIARSLDDLEVGQWIVYSLTNGGWEIPYQYNGKMTAAFFDERTVLLLSESDTPPPQFYRRKAHALIAARAIALVIGGEVQPHNRWGRIQDPDSYGPDPERSVG